MSDVQSGLLGDFVSQICGGGTPSRENSEYWTGKVPWVSVKDLASSNPESSAEKISEQGLASSASRLIPAGIPIVATRMAVGRSAVFSIDVAINQDLKAIFPNEEMLDRKYLCHFLKANEETLTSKGTGSTVKGIRLEDLEQLPIAIPPLTEQKKIAEILSGIDRCIAQTKLRIQKQNLINESLLSGIEDLRVDKFAKHEATIGDISSKVGSGITPRGGSDTYESEGITFIRSQNVLRMRLSLDDAVRIPQHIHDSMSGTRVLPQDVLLNITGASIGRSAVVPDGIGEANVNQHVCIIRTTGMCDPLFLCGWLNSKSGQIAINSSQAGGNRQGLNFEQIKAMSIPLPPIHLQKKIATALQASNIHTQSLKARFDWLLNLKSAVSSDLLSGRRRVSV